MYIIQCSLHVYIYIYLYECNQHSTWVLFIHCYACDCNFFGDLWTASSRSPVVPTSACDCHFFRMTKDSEQNQSPTKHIHLNLLHSERENSKKLDSEKADSSSSKQKKKTAGDQKLHVWPDLGVPDVLGAGDRLKTKTPKEEVVQ